MSLRILLYPFSVLYGLIIRLRNLFFDVSILQTKSFTFPVIAVGNLTTGGTGKTPHVAYLVSLLKEHFKVATISRGYGRKTKGFFIANEQSSAPQIGDEPLLYYHRFGKAVTVGVGEKRVEAIEKIKQVAPQTQVMVLDDAFQHRYVKAGLNILLTDFRHPYFNDLLLPAGNLREPQNGIKRADIIIVTKCPDDLTEVVQKVYKTKISPFPNQQLFFSGLKYDHLISMKDDSSFTLSDLKDYDVLLVTGIANPKPMKKFLESIGSKIFLLRFNDHHEYHYDDMLFIERNFNTIASTKKIIITTEKDAMRLREPSLAAQVVQLPYYYLPLEIYFINHQTEFNQYIIKYVTEN